MGIYVSRGLARRLTIAAPEFIRVAARMEALISDTMSSKTTRRESYSLVPWMYPEQKRFPHLCLTAANAFRPHCY